MRRYVFILATLTIILAAVPLFSEENKTAAITPSQEGASTAPAAALKEAPVQPKELAIYGEIQSVNATSNSISIQYYDYESDEEKTVDVIINPETKMENANSLNDIKAGDWADVTYALSGGKNIAKSVAVEKEEEESAGVKTEEISEESSE